MRDFWSRWHMSLSTWFRDYVYIPLGGSRHGRWLTYRNLFLTMVISGLWHGAAWTFVIWGVLHGTAYVLLRPLEEAAWYRRAVPVWLKRVFVFGFVCLTWIFFRADSLNDALTIVQRITTGTWTDPALPLLAAALVGVIFVYEWLVESQWQAARLGPVLRVAVYVAMIIYLSFAPGSIDQPFIYFQF
jgi:D-alanyl-lipoteichoic acid acyltransferase DltB (MBOAT superfamily)